MRISMVHRFVYISTPKVCTHTIYRVLDEHYDKGLIREAFHSNQIPPHLWDFFVWSVCRNPYTRALSLWWSACRLHPPDQYGFRKGCGAADDFTRFIVWLSHTKLSERHELMKNQTEWLAPCEPVATIHMENLAEGLAELSFWKPDISLPHMNTTDAKIEAQSAVEGQQIVKPHWRELYQEREAREAVLRWAGDDFARFNYSTDVERCEE